MKKLNTFAKLTIASSMAFGAVAPTVMMMAPIHAEEAVEDEAVQDTVVQEVVVQEEVAPVSVEETKVAPTVTLKSVMNLTVKVKGDKVVVKDGKKVLTENVDYTLERTESSVKIKGINNYTGEKEVPFTVMEEAESEDSEETATENETPVVTEEKEESEQEDKKEESEKEDKKEESEEKKEEEEPVEKTDISEAAVVLVNRLVYNGEEQTQEVKLVLGEYELVAGEDYTVSGNTAKEVGTYTMTITGAGEKFTGSEDVDYTVEAAPVEKTDISKATVQLTNTLTANGAYQTQTVKLTYENQVLVEGKDYTVTDNVVKEAGTYTMTITAKGDRFQGSVKVKYTVAAAKEKKKEVHTAVNTNVGLFATLVGSSLALATAAGILFARKK